MQNDETSRTVGRPIYRLVLAGLLTVAATGAQAALLNVDFNTSTSATYSGAAVLGASGDTWNGVSAGGLGVPGSASNVALVDSGGNATSATLSFTSTSGAFNAGVGPLFAGALMSDYMYTVGTVTLTLNGLTAGDLFDLVLYSSANLEGRSTSFKVGDTTKTTVAAATGNVFAESVNYARFSGTVGAGGTLSFDLIGTNDFFFEGNLNGFQLDLTRG